MSADSVWPLESDFSPAGTFGDLDVDHYWRDEDANTGVEYITSQNDPGFYAHDEASLSAYTFEGLEAYHDHIRPLDSSLGFSDSPSTHNQLRQTYQDSGVSSVPRTFESPVQTDSDASFEQTSEANSRKRKSHFIKGFMKEAKGNQKPTWYIRHSTEDDKTVLGDFVQCRCADSDPNTECNGQLCLIASNGKCLVEGCPYDKMKETPRSDKNGSKSSNSSSPPSRHVAMHLRPFHCPRAGCKYAILGFALQADLQRHLDTDKAHGGGVTVDPAQQSESKTKSCYPCPFIDCARNKKPFKRPDNLITHRRSIHGEDIPRRRGRPARTPQTPS